MVRRRFFASPAAFAADRGTVLLGSDEARHLRDVLRLERGNEVFIFDGQGKEFRCAILDLSRGGATLEVCDEVVPARPESRLQLTLALALLKADKFDLVVQKATELGVKRMIPVVTRFADVRIRDQADGLRRAERWKRIALEACKQSGRALVPDIEAPISFRSLLDSSPLEAGEWRVIFSERGGCGLREGIRDLNNQPTAVTAVVGSEGGWSDEELELAHDAGWGVVTLGGRTLRAETAAIAVTTLLQHVFGDLV